MKPPIPPPPPHFYKYRPLSAESLDFTRRIIVENELYWSSPLNFNDPFDSFPSHRVIGDNRKKKSEFRRVIKKFQPDMSRNDRRLLSRRATARTNTEIEEDMMSRQNLMNQMTGVCCLTTKCDNILMWSHYADSHKGLCLRFRTQSRFYPKIFTSDLYFELAFPVIYSINRPMINIVDPVRDNLVDELFLTKADIWKYEEEWRLINHTDGPGIYKYPPDRLDGIILGANISGNYILDKAGWFPPYNHAWTSPHPVSPMSKPPASISKLCVGRTVPFARTAARLTLPA